VFISFSSVAGLKCSFHFSKAFLHFLKWCANIWQFFKYKKDISKIYFFFKINPAGAGLD